MFSKIRTALTAAIIGIACMGLSATPVAAANNGLCAANQWPPDQTGQWYFSKSTASTFAEAIGYLTDRALYPCEGLASQGWSFAAAVNLQRPGCNAPYHPNCIWQLGMFQDGGNAGDQNYFVYTPGSGSGQALKITSPRPTFGVRYKFRIFQTGTVLTYGIYSANTGTVLWSFNTGWSWPSPNFAWYGYETGNSRSLAGIDPADSAADLVGLYRVTGGSLLTITNISSTCVSPSGGPTCTQRANRVVSGGSNEIFNVRGLTTG